MQARISLAHSLKYPYKPINYFGPPQIFPTYYPNTFHILPKHFPMLLPNLGLHKYYPIFLTYYYLTWAPTNTSHTGPINYFGLTQILIIPLPKLGHKIMSSQLIYLVGKTQKAQQNSLTKPVATRHL